MAFKAKQYETITDLANDMKANNVTFVSLHFEYDGRGVDNVQLIGDNTLQYELQHADRTTIEIMDGDIFTLPTLEEIAKTKRFYKGHVITISEEEYITIAKGDELDIDYILINIVGEDDFEKHLNIAKNIIDAKIF